MKDLIKQIRKARFVFTCGNGGSAATAEHFTNDLFSKGIKAICLNSNTSIMTMIANDYEYSQVFGRQLYVYANAEDLLITISCSGTSPNIVAAHGWAEELGMKTYSFDTFEGNDRNYEKLENKHLQLVHKIKKAL
jgi:D-sedoheptulose 7-phosphate isomerase